MGSYGERSREQGNPIAVWDPVVTQCGRQTAQRRAILRSFDLG